MRKSTLVVLGIVLLAFGSMMWLLSFYTEQVRFELETAGEWTRALKETGDLRPDTHVKLFREKGGPDHSTTDAAAHGLLAEVYPSDATWARDPSGGGIALMLARWAFERYGPDRPIDWIEVKVRREGGSEPETVSFAKGDGGLPVPIGPSRPALNVPPPRHPASPVVPPPAVPTPGTPASPPGPADPVHPR